MCSSARPRHQQECKLDLCPAFWTTTSWSQVMTNVVRPSKHTKMVYCLKFSKWLITFKDGTESKIFKLTLIPNDFSSFCKFEKKHILSLFGTLVLHASVWLGIQHYSHSLSFEYSNHSFIFKYREQKKTFFSNQT